ncbi:hypothetical protein OG963_41075 [Streptomyces sp. NBC_01707]|uniref:hypothetical protein n=1 Tax=unclassified Streptomyces TaxID=2593676 RepID=UPI0029AED02F|nr:hypothetical protein [Streptomyces sp. AK08-01A]MDX3767473.1 hypothetical protein [Streptomyces sp. AK08-01B]MDX3820257.1 hypothetical protein [Streptomyces sp. AK08-01A]
MGPPKSARLNCRVACGRSLLGAGTRGFAQAKPSAPTLVSYPYGQVAYTAPAIAPVVVSAPEASR